MGQKSTLIIGMGRTGQSTAAWIQSRGGRVIPFDDTHGEGHISHISEVPWNDIEQIVPSPGIPFSYPNPHPLIAAGLEKNIPIVSDINLLRDSYPGNLFVGITGTNGKSTTTALLGHILRENGKDVAVGGNIGQAALSLPPLGPQGIYVLELSSFQLEISRPLNLDVAAWLNITPDHLDRHGTMENYVRAKERIFEGARCKIMGADDPYSEKVALRQKPQKIIHIEEYKGSTFSNHHYLKGVHNLQNIVVAFECAMALGLEEARVIQAILGFKGLEHRQEFVASFKNITFINDSKATNSDAAARALESYKDQKIIWIAGGKPKSEGIEDLKPYFPALEKTFLIGEAQESFSHTLGEFPHSCVGHLEAAVEKAVDLGLELQESCVVLFSPACASFDQFKDFEDRGRQFRQLVLEKVMLRKLPLC
jgi:UDP-N-acetylmuramoylalanine--D-glutamate ligase